MSRRTRKKLKRHLTKPKMPVVPTNSNNPGYKSWKEILNGRHETPFGYICYDD